MTTTLPTQQRIDELVSELEPDVVRIRLNVAPDWSGQPAMYFRVVLADEASRVDRLAGVTQRVTEKLSDELNLDTQELFPYFRFRSQSEQTTLQDPSWQ